MHRSSWEIHAGEWYWVGKDTAGHKRCSDNTTLSREDAPRTSVVYHGNRYNKWGGECLTLPEQCAGEVVKTVGFVGGGAKIAIGFAGTN